MPDHDFVYSYVPAGYAARVQWLAVLFPLLKPYHNAREVRYGTEKLSAWWRYRIEELRGRGWQPLESTQRIQAARNCCPTFSFATPRSRPCHLRTICPFCHARWTRNVWLAAEKLFHAEDAAEPKWYRGDEDVEDPVDAPLCSRYLLVERYTTYNVKYLDSRRRDQRLGQLLACIPAARSAAVAKLAPAGTLQLTTVEPQEKAWHVRNRQLLVYNEKQALPAEFFQEQENCVVRVHTLPTLAALLSAVSRVCRYPTALMTGEPGSVAQLLELRRQLKTRLTATYGLFRGSEL